jgi:hypothetical protein
MRLLIGVGNNPVGGGNVTVGDESKVGVGKGSELGVAAAQAEEKHSPINRMNQTRIAIS